MIAPMDVRSEIAVEAGDWPGEDELCALVRQSIAAAMSVLGSEHGSPRPPRWGREPVLHSPPLRGRAGEGGEPQTPPSQFPQFPHAHIFPDERENAKRLRRHATPAEKLLWTELRAHRLAGLRFRRQVPMGRYVADFVCHDARLVVEADGEAHRDEERDRERDAWFASKDYTTLRFRNEEILTFPDRVLAQIKSAAQLSPPQGGRGSIKAEKELSLLFTDNSAVRRLNARFRGKDKPTNVLSFPQNSDILLGDIILAYETVRDEAALAGTPMKAHMAHLVIHGFLHLLGYDHEGEADAEAMEAVERAALERIGIADPYAAAQGQ